MGAVSEFRESKAYRTMNLSKRNPVKRIVSVFVGLMICMLIANSNTSEDQMAMIISVKANGNTTVFELNNSPAARDLYAQLPLSITVEDYGDNEKIFYPPKKLNTTDTPLADDGRAGTLAYYAPWGDVVMFYKGFSSAPGLYELGHVTSGREYIPEMSGTIQIEKGSAR
jgi:hypothetical protein